LRPGRKPGWAPAPGPRESARAAPRARKYRRAARLGCNGAQWSPGVRQQQPRALLEDTGLQSRPITDGSTETPTTDAQHVCANGPIFHMSPGPDQPPQSFNYELDRPGCDTRSLRRDMSFATGVDKVVLTRCVQHLPPPTLPADTPASRFCTTHARCWANDPRTAGGGRGIGVGPHSPPLYP
jgi:hypothetical protein